MAFLKLIFKNIWRHKSRTVLTVLGISLGIGTIVLLGILTGGLKKSLEKTIKTGEADFTVAQANVADFSFSQVTEEQVKEIQETKGVEEAVGVLWGFTKTQQNPFFVLFGIEEGDAELMGIDVTKGRLFDDNKKEAVIGKIAADSLDLKVGDDLPVREEKFKVVGVFQTGNPMQDGGALVPLERLQKIEKKEGKVTMVLVKVTDDVKDIEEFTKEIEEKFNGDLAALAEVQDFKSVDQGLEITDFLSTAISVLAVFIGGIGVMN
ncbi:MAG: ABC transporter permease, partial [Actinobacteria bacterium]